MKKARKYFVVSLIVLVIVFRMPFNMLMIPIAESIVTLGGSIPSTAVLIFSIMSIRFMIAVLGCIIIWSNIFKVFTVEDEDSRDIISYGISFIFLLIDMISFYAILCSIYQV